MSGHVLCFRGMMGFLGLAAGATFGALGGADAALAKQFAGEGQQVRLPPTVYDPELQMMVDPATRQPIYDKNWKVAAKCPVRNKPPQCK